MANLQRIRTGSTGALTALERESLHELVKEYNSDFRVKAATVPFVGDILPEEGAIVISDHDGRMYYADEFGWHISGAEAMTLMIFFSYDGITQMGCTWRAASDKTVVFDWGNGVIDSLQGQDSTYTITPSPYTGIGNFTVKISGDISDMDYFLLEGGLSVKCHVSGMALLTSVTQWSLSSIGLYGDIALLKEFSDVNIFVVNCPFVSGDLSQFGDRTAILNVISCPLTTWSKVISLSSMSDYNRFCNNGWDSNSVDNCIISHGGLSAANLYVSRNSPMTERSKQSAIDILQNGGVLAVSETAPLGSLGPELFVTACAASDPNGNEAGSVAGFINVGLDNAGNRFEAISNNIAAGKFSIIADANGTPTANAGFELSPPITVEVGELYRMSEASKHIGSGSKWRCYKFGIVVQTQVDISYTEYGQVVTYMAALIDSLDLKYNEQGTTNDGGMYYDNVSVKKVTL